MSLQDALKELTALFGEECIRRLDDETTVKSVRRIPSGSIILDDMLGGGWPIGRICEIYGPESCLHKDTFIHYTTTDRETGKIKNSKGGTIRSLCLKFHNKYDHHLVHKNCEYTVPSINSDGAIFSNRVLNVSYCGEKECYLLKTASGFSIKATVDHKFLTSSGYKPLSDLNIGDNVYVNNGKTKGRSPASKRKSVCVKTHPTAPIKKVHCNKTGYTYYYKRLPLSHLHWEAYQNGLDVKTYRNILNNGNYSNIVTVPKGMHIHHLNENYNDNSRENLLLIDPSYHGSIHCRKGQDINCHKRQNSGYLRKLVSEDFITDIEFYGNEDTYDISCEFPNNNYIADGIVVHNSGKTTLTLHAIAEMQKYYDRNQFVCFIDTENALDPAYVRALGVDEHKFYLSQPTDGNEVFEVAHRMAKQGAVRMIVIDSIAGIVPRQVEEGDVGDANIAAKARLMSAEIPKLITRCATNDICCIFTNQEREKPGVSFGNPTYTPGGKALPFYSSIRLRVQKIGQPSEESGEKVSNTVKCKVVKNKTAPPFKEGEITLRYGIGVDLAGELIEKSIQLGLMEKRGSWFYKVGKDGVTTKLQQGLSNMTKWLRENQTRQDKLRQVILKKLSLK
jgi:recombination protein RecA